MSKIRRCWKINPKTRIKESQKRYIRERIKRELKKLIEDAKEILEDRSTKGKSSREDI